MTILEKNDSLVPRRIAVRLLFLAGVVLGMLGSGVIPRRSAATLFDSADMGVAWSDSDPGLSIGDNWWPAMMSVNTAGTVAQWHAYYKPNTVGNDEVVIWGKDVQTGTVAAGSTAWWGLVNNNQCPLTRFAGFVPGSCPGTPLYENWSGTFSKDTMGTQTYVHYAYSIPDWPAYSTIELAGGP